MAAKCTCCFQWFKDTNLKANHNGLTLPRIGTDVVSNGSKILIWKQITTFLELWCYNTRCFQWFKDTNLKANHNFPCRMKQICPVVSNGSKILIWKQITTQLGTSFRFNGCFQWFKDTNLKANHNTSRYGNNPVFVVSNGSKILIWKQITTSN